MSDMIFILGENEIEVTVSTIGTGVGFKRDKFVGDGVETAFACTYAPIQDSLEVLLNGIPQEIDVDFTLSGSGIIFATAPEDDWKIEAKYAHGQQLAYASTTPMYEKFAGNDLTTVFALAGTRIANTLQVTIDGIVKELAVDYTETGSGASITFATAPPSGAVIEVWYEKSS